MNKIELYHGDNLQILTTSINVMPQCVIIDPPFNTGKRQSLKSIKVIEDTNGDRTGFGGKKYSTIESGVNRSYNDSFDNFEAFLMPRIKISFDLLTPNGCIFIHLNQRESHYIKVAMDKLVGRDKFISDIIWSYDFGARSKTKWSAKHDNILWYVKNPKNYIFNYDAIDRIPYLSPDLVGKEKAAKGKTLTDVWWNTIVPTNSKERVNYPTQKPMKIYERIVKVHTNKDDTILDFFAGSSTTLDAAAKHKRNSIGIDQNQEAIDVSIKRLSKYGTPVQDNNKYTIDF